MNEERRSDNNSRGLTGIILAIGMLWMAGASVAFAQTYIGPEGCLEACHSVGAHEQAFNDWTASGHPYKLASREDAMGRPILLPEGMLWTDISYVIGGFKWKSRYMGNDGYIITTTPFGVGDDVDNQFNYLTGTWSDYHPNEVLPYTCGSCHTTGWVADTDAASDGTLTDNQDMLPGIHGTWAFPGITCESCHGASAMGPDGFSDHGARAYASSAENCGTCHIRGDANTIPASGGFIRHHEQYNEFLASPHKNMDCTTCHDAHKRSEYSIIRDCEGCHPVQTSAFMDTTMFAAGVECVDCHMAKATKSAAALGPNEGDVMTHLFRINTDADYQMFNGDSSFVNLSTIDGDPNQGEMNLRFACLGCHGGQDAAWAETYAEDFHSTEFRITGGISGTWWGGLDRDGEGWVIEYANFFVASLYTYNNAGDATWVFGVGTPETTPGMRNTVTVAMEIPTEGPGGPSFGADYDADLKNTVDFGTATFTFTSCTMGAVVITPNQAMIDLGYEAITIPISRLTSPLISCPGTG